MARDAGLDGPYLVASLGESDYPTHVADGFDAGVSYQFPFGYDLVVRIRDSLMARGFIEDPKRYPYADTFLELPGGLRGPVFPYVYPNWDNTPCSVRGGVLARSATLEWFGAQVRGVLEIVRAMPGSQQMLVIKSWHE
jgi:hypothetical protein